MVPRATLQVGDVRLQLGCVDDLDCGGGQRWLVEQPVLDDHTQEEGPGADHDGSMRQQLGPGAGNVVVVEELGDGGQQNRVASRRDHQVVGDTGGSGRLEDGVVGLAISFELLERNRVVAEGVHVEIDASIVVEDKVANGIGALDGERVFVPSIQEPRVFGLDEVAGGLVGPQLREVSTRQKRGHCRSVGRANLVLEILVGLLAGLLRVNPFLGDHLGSDGLVEDARYRLGRLSWLGRGRGSSVEGEGEAGAEQLLVAEEESDEGFEEEDDEADEDDIGEEEESGVLSRSGQSQNLSRPGGPARDRSSHRFPPDEALFVVGVFSVNIGDEGRG